MQKEVIIVGGGAAGFFAAIHIAEAQPNIKVTILERGGEVLTKVRVSGGGRCNVTHAEFDPGELVQHYPRGERELLGPFHTFCSGDTVAFFEERGVELKIESDGRMFPTTDSSQSIIDCFLAETERLGVSVLTNHSVKNIQKEGSRWKLQTNMKDFECDQLLMTTGSNPKMWKVLEGLGHTIVPPVPSLFTFNIKDPRINGLMGVATSAQVQLLDAKQNPLKEDNQKRADRGGSEGPLLITHWGMSGPAILKLSAWGARALHRIKYSFSIQVNWVPELEEEAVVERLKDTKASQPKKTVLKTNVFELPKRLWQSLILASKIQESERWADISNKKIEVLAAQLTRAIFHVNGKSTFKEEFVTAGGIDLKEVNFKTFESKVHKELYFAGEILDIDAVTGGFNFQNAWTGAYIAAKTISS